MPSFRDIVGLLPYRLRLRFESLGSYVAAIVDEAEEDLPEEGRLTSEEIQFLQLLVFVYSLQDFLREGSVAARAAVTSLSNLGIDGFTVGRTLFEGENDNVRLGETLADRLRPLLSILGPIIGTSTFTSSRDMVLYLMQRVKHGRNVD